ncbi:MAG: hypothetical protein P8Y62_11055, partial [candidate division WOR-3 bacterium]
MAQCEKFFCKSAFKRNYPISTRTVFSFFIFSKGMKENASIFCHTQGWAIAAETILGNGNQAYEYLRAFMPS